MQDSNPEETVDLLKSQKLFKDALMKVLGDDDVDVC